MVEICSHHLMTQPEPLSGLVAGPLPAQLESLVLACLAKSAKDRPESADALERVLSSVMQVDTWTQDDARAWWQDHREDLVRVRRRRTASGGDSAKPRILRSATLAYDSIARPAAAVERR